MTSGSNSDSGRARVPVTIRPVQCPRTFVCGLRIAASIRSVIGARGIRSFECTLATTRSSWASSSSSWSSPPSSRMSTSIPVRIRNGASSSLSSATSTSCARSRSADSPLATVSRGEWSVSTM